VCARVEVCRELAELLDQMVDVFIVLHANRCTWIPPAGRDHCRERVQLVGIYEREGWRETRERERERKRNEGERGMGERRERACVK
jgi:hypothetical protein